MSYVFAIINFLNSLWQAYKEWQRIRTECRRRAAEKAAAARERAAADLVACETEEKCDAASDALHDSSK